MNFAIGADHRGVRYKDLIKELLLGAGHQVEDMGTDSSESVDYPDYARAVAAAVSSGRAERGVLICSSGIGMSIAANRFSGVRAALCLNEQMARTARTHNDSNVLCLGQDLIDEKRARAILHTWLRTDFEGGRHRRRVGKIDGKAPSP